ncbi:MAG TPA: phosphatase PAP2 family protein [Mycobacterium sp.]|uniref:phosphatase PAP2 family protein n=1 Tax=Mycolicibacterium sp. TaxID=2320850 RepID=UPI0025E8156B|nr:phosphatase PAP2 family protein [Mycolicibacterium sp.]HPX36435.1 phosphatase PAP2 family protein [Mycobacterium sp.]HQC77088.1 phosphatase PAP2 family protein [Mycobacterium sp.]
MGWPFVGMPLMVLLGLGVRDGMTPVDSFFQQAHGGPLSWLLFFTDERTAKVLLLATLAVSVYRRLWPLAVAAVVVPVAAWAATEALKPVFGRLKDQGLAYPSGHTTVMVVLLGLLILAVGVKRWIVLAAIVFAVLGILGQAVSYHYFTDAVGSTLLGTSLVCLAVVALRRLRI